MFTEASGAFIAILRPQGALISYQRPKVRLSLRCITTLPELYLAKLAVLEDG